MAAAVMLRAQEEPFAAQHTRRFSMDDATEARAAAAVMLRAQEEPFAEPSPAPPKFRRRASTGSLNLKAPSIIAPPTEHDGVRQRSSMLAHVAVEATVALPFARGDPLGAFGDADVASEEDANPSTEASFKQKSRALEGKHAAFKGKLDELEARLSTCALSDTSHGVLCRAGQVEEAGAGTEEASETTGTTPDRIRPTVETGPA